MVYLKMAEEYGFPKQNDNTGSKNVKRYGDFTNIVHRWQWIREDLEKYFLSIDSVGKLQITGRELLL